jgi:muramoyltetrapeptide carboxypeptidase
MGKNALQIIEDVTKKYNIPVVYNFQRDTSATELVRSIVHLDVSSVLEFE